MAYDPFGSGEFGASPFDDIFARFFGGAVPQRPQRIDIGQLLTEQGREVIRDAATQAARWGDPDLDTDHLLWATTKQEPVRRLLSAAGADPDAIARQIEAQAEHGQPREERAEPHAGVQAGAAGRAADLPRPGLVLHRPRAPPVRARPQPGLGRRPGARDARVTPEALQEAVTSGGRGGRSGPEAASDTPMLDQFGTDLTALARDGRARPGDRPRRRDRADRSRSSRRRTKNNPVLVGEAGVGKTAIVEGLAQRDRRRRRARAAARQARHRARPARHARRHPYRGDFEERLTKIMDEITRPQRRADRLHRRAAHGRRRRRRRRGRHGRRQHPEARASPAASCTSSVRPRSRSTASTSRRTPRSSAASSRCRSASRRSRTPC